MKRPKVPFKLTFWFLSDKALSDVFAVLFVPKLVSNDPDTLSVEAFLRIILITAVAAPEPYKVEEAPFNISIDSIWFVANKRKSNS